jgi:hypothetical protein
MISRYLFRDGVLSYKGTSLSTFDGVSAIGDFMLCIQHPIVGTKHNWVAFRMVFFDPGFGWHPQPESVTQELRALLLLQQ